MKKTGKIIGLLMVLMVFVAGCSSMQRHVNTPSDAYSVGYNDGVENYPMAGNIAKTSDQDLTVAQREKINEAYQNGYQKGQETYQKNQNRDAVIGAVKDLTIGSGSKSQSTSHTKTSYTSGGSTTKTTTTTGTHVSW